MNARLSKAKLLEGLKRELERMEQQIKDLEDLAEAKRLMVKWRQLWQTFVTELET